MALITLPVGVVLVPWIGPAITLAGQSWFNTTNLAAVYKPSANRAGYISNAPGSGFPAFAQVVPTTAGAVPEAYIFVVKVAFQLDSALIGQPVLTPTRLVASFPAGQTALAVALPIAYADQVGSYGLDSSTGLSSLAYAKNGGATSLPVTVALNDTLTVTATTASGVAGLLTLTKQ